MRRPLFVLVAGLAAVHLLSGISNTVDLIASAAGWSEGAWRSGNVAWVQTTVEAGHLHIGSARAWGYGVVAGAATCETLSGILLAVAAYLLVRRADSVAPTRRWVRWGVTVALVNWLGLTIGSELFITYETQGWTQFVLLAIVLVAMWIAVEVLDFAVPETPTDPTDPA